MYYKYSQDRARELKDREREPYYHPSVGLRSWVALIHNILKNVYVGLIM